MSEIGLESAADMKRITEVGVAVHDLDACTELMVDLFGATVGPLVPVPLYDMQFRMLRVGKVDFEVMEPSAERGVIWDFLKKRGQGLHHIAFAVDDIDATTETLRRKGVSFVDEAPMTNRFGLVDYAGREFNDEIKFTFSHPASIMGILFEYIQYPEGYNTD
jgi:methylmalonyl-CoA epimerase